MKALHFTAGMVLLACNLAGFAQTEAVCGQNLDVPLRSRATLTIDSRAAGLEIVGADQETLHVSCTMEGNDDPERVRIQFTGNKDDGKLTISSGSLKNGGLQIRLEVPRKTNLRVKMSAGEVKINEITGDKDIDLYAGRIAVASNRPWDYRKIDLSVTVGEVKASTYGADKGGFFRSFTRRTASGEYGLFAHVIAGEIDLSSAPAGGASE